MRYPAFFQWRIFGIGNFFNHLEFLSIYQWTSGHFIRLALTLFLIAQAFNIRKKKHRLFIQLLICILYLALMLAPISLENLFSFLTNYYYAVSSIFGVVLTLFIAILIKTSKNRTKSYEK